MPAISRELENFVEGKNPAGKVILIMFLKHFYLSSALLFRAL